MCQLRLVQSGTPPAHNGHDRPIRPPSQTPLLSLPAAGEAVWELLVLGFVTFSCKCQKDVPSSFRSSSTPLFIRASARFLSGDTMYCYPQAETIAVAQRRRKDRSATAELKERDFVPPSAGRDVSVHPKAASSSASAHSFSDRSPVGMSGQICRASAAAVNRRNHLPGLLQTNYSFSLQELWSLLYKNNYTHQLAA